MRRPVLCLIVVALTVVACQGILATPIRKILESPREYDGKTVTISGEVTSVFSLLVMKYFVVADGTGEIAVVTHRSLPKKGEKIRVKGRVSEVFSLGDSQAIVIVEERNEP